MAELSYAPLSIACVRGLSDKLYEKRKYAGVEIEKMVKDFKEANNTSQIKRLIRVLGQDLMASTNPNVKNGALMGLSSVAVALGKDSADHLPSLTQPIVACFSEGETRVRYQAAEALYNVVKAARGAALTLFPEVFDGLARLSADPEPQVKQAAEMLDRLLKDVVTECSDVEPGGLLALLRSRLRARAPAARVLALSWLAALDAVPGLDLRPALPLLLDPLLQVLADPQPEIRRMCDVQLSELLRGVRAAPGAADLRAVVNVLIVHAQSPEELVQLTSLRWLAATAELAPRTLLPRASGALLAALPCLAYSDDARNIRETASSLNAQLMQLVADSADAGDPSSVPASTDPASAVPASDVPSRSKPGADGGGERRESDASAVIDDDEEDGTLDVSACVAALARLARAGGAGAEPCKVAALDWLLHLLAHRPLQMMSCTDAAFAAALGVLREPADPVLSRGLALAAEICELHAQDAKLESTPYYAKFVAALVKLFAEDEAFLEDRGPFIIRQVCVVLNAESALVSLSDCAAATPGAAAAAAVVHQLAAQLLTAPELYELRRRLRTADDASTRALFVALYRSWAHSAVSLLALCLLAHHYAHCHALVELFGDLEITVDFLTEVDKLVQLIESPVFAYLRLELVGGGAASGWLRAALGGVLMLLPQGDAFLALQRRLQCAPPPPPRSELVEPPAPDGVPLDELLRHFLSVQERRRAPRRSRV